jgi:hypothetical protein
LNLSWIILLLLTKVFLLCSVSLGASYSFKFCSVPIALVL